nr:hypothetical protein Iba_chr12bCG4460 [Ipomoea batatas]
MEPPFGNKHPKQVVQEGTAEKNCSDLEIGNSNNLENGDNQCNTLVCLDLSKQRKHVGKQPI